jgi:hypothetical protein
MRGAKYHAMGTQNEKSQFRLKNIKLMVETTTKNIVTYCNNDAAL